MSSSPFLKLSGVESISGVLLSFLSLLISAQFCFKPKLLSPFIHWKVISTIALSPGFNNLFFNWSVVTVFPSSDNFHFGLSS